MTVFLTQKWVQRAVEHILCNCPHSATCHAQTTLAGHCRWAVTRMSETMEPQESPPWAVRDPRTADKMDRCIEPQKFTQVSQGPRNEERCETTCQFAAVRPDLSHLQGSSGTGLRGGTRAERCVSTGQPETNCGDVQVDTEPGLLDLCANLKPELIPIPVATCDIT